MLIDNSKLQQIITFVIVQLIVIAAFVIFYLFRYQQASLLQVIKAIGPLFVITTVGIAVIIKDRHKMKRMRQKGEENEFDERYNTITELKHDIAIYLGALLVISVPIAKREIIFTSDLIQAAVAYLALYYTKHIYWRL
ncbi:MAG: hypothetical protein COT81_00525 [Candidatus Buchananbacteria bacterium CG10_big_fil_rev_8_21_14_0_10_42_9]|uniref:DUF2178 domain-containing protein n=1 Tax=Candidatus Buchananbacteria bacterium CG10_big_fil_rev_8_21_14_0_10_42_9 TaxID=1974526 RepID=A0A2H0W2C2_9BACT|nr:MAG: hypothetical protein COT81_00525 [Candidatus Buchananbacteria bacterium CG10_big_fil_rev_8_21_14_0_10_42_9]